MEKQRHFKPEMAKLFFEFFVIEKALSSIFNAAYAQYNISTKQWLVLVVAIKVQNASVSFIAKTLCTSHQNVKVIAQSLEKTGWVKLIVASNDKRKTCVIPTQKVTKFSTQQSANDEKLLDQLFSIFNATELTLLTEYLGRFEKQIKLFI